MTHLYKAILSKCFLILLSICTFASDAYCRSVKQNDSITENYLEKKNISGSKSQSLIDEVTKLNGPGPFSYFGYSVSTAGDINGDGYSDIIVGSPYHDSSRGAVYVYLGSSAGILTTASVILHGPESGSQFGTAIASAGDVNGDGFGDVIIGTVVRQEIGAPNIGSAYVYLGSSDGLSTSPANILLGTAAGFYGSTTLAGMGDVNGDGFSDIIVGRSEVTNTPKIFAFYGSASGLPQQPSERIMLLKDNNAFGKSMAGVGDVNGDGYGDMLVSSYHSPSGTGSAHLYLGSPSGISIISAVTLTGNSNSVFGFSVAAARDINGDGYNDVAISDYQYASDKGAVFIYLGNSSGITTTPASTLIGFSPHSSFGVSVASAGDENADGYADILIGASGYDYTFGTSNGYLFHGSKAGLVTTDYQNLVGPELKSAFGYSVSSAGDVNGDGRSDIIIGAYQSNMESGAAFVYLGKTSLLAQTASNTFIEPVVNSLFALINTSAGDLNGDGFSDIAIGANEHSDNKGIVYIYYGSPNGIPKNPSLTLEAPSEQSRFGGSLAAAGDVNGDGYGDLIIGAPAFNNYIGAAYIYLGGPQGLSSNPATILTGQWYQSFTYAMSVAGAGDINGDGYADVIVGDSRADLVYVHMGSAAGIVQEASVILMGDGGRFGWSIANAGDVNADGYNDVVIGDYERKFNQGAAYVYYGSSNGLSPTNMTRLNGISANNLFGIAVSSAGDINGDGYSDILVGASNLNTVKVFLGGPEGITAEKTSQITGPVDQSSFGASLASAGDVNGDGYSDVIIGAYQQDGGFAYIYQGDKTGLNTEPKITLHGASSTIIFGSSVAGAGDVNGDGYSDVLSTSYLLPSREIASQLFNGNNQGKYNNVLKLYNTDFLNPINKLNLKQSLFGIGLFVNPFAGAVRARLVWETKPNGQPFSSSGSITSYTGYSGSGNDWTDIPSTGTELKVLATKSAGVSTKVRVRVQYRSSDLPSGQVFGPWIYPQDYSNGVLGQKSTPLPVSLTFFSVKPEQTTAKLEWQTAWESGSKSFEIEHSIDARHWNTLGFVDAKQNTSQVSQYIFIHSSPLSGSNLYRLKMIDSDNSFTYSLIRDVSFQGSEFLTVYPNPATELIKIKLPGHASTSDLKALNIFNADGKNVLYKYKIVNGELHVSDLPAGVYVFSLHLKTNQFFKGKFWVYHP